MVNVIRSERTGAMPEQSIRVVKEYYDRVINGRDLDAVEEYFADARMVEGVRRGCFAYFNAFPDLHVSLDEVIADGDRVFVRSTTTGTHDGDYKGIEPTGRHMSVESAEVFHVKDGRFESYWCLANVAGLMRQLTEEPAAATTA